MFSHITNFSGRRPEHRSRRAGAVPGAVFQGDGGHASWTAAAWWTSTSRTPSWRFFGAPVKKDDDSLRSVLAGIDMTRGASRVQPPPSLGRPAAVQRQRRHQQGQGHRGDNRDRGQDELHRHRGRGEPCLPAQRPDESLQAGAHHLGEPHRFGEGRAAVPAPGLGGREGPQAGGEDLHSEAQALRRRRAKAGACTKWAWQSTTGRNFTQAAAHFRDALKAMPGDPVAAMLLERSQKYRATPPPAEWDGVEVMTHK